MPRSAPAFARATRYLQQLISRTSGDGQCRLPTVDVLARGAGVARGAMLRAVRAMKLGGVLTVSHGRGINTTGRPVSGTPNAQEPAPVRPEGPRRQWARLAETIRREVLTGVYSDADQLPSSKQLASRYGTCHRTLQRALQSLIDDGTLERSGRAYRVAVLHRKKGHGTVVLMMNTLTDGRLALSGVWRRRNLHTLQRACARLGVNLAIVPLSGAGGRMTVQGKDVEKFREPAGVGTVLGYVVWTAGPSPRGMSLLVEKLNRTGTPIALLDERGDHFAGRARYAGRRLQVFTLGMATEAGMRVGEALQSAGHRRVAFIWPNPGAVGVQNRLDGLCRTFADAGIGDGVQAFTVQATTDGGTLGHGTPTSHRGAAALMKRWFRHPQCRTLILPPERLPFERKLRTTITRGELRRDLEPLFDKTLSDGSITAWVCSSDSVATVALDYLEERGVAVPGRLSVVGFDNSAEALAYELTSYDFNCEASVLAMLHYVLGTLWPAHRKPGPPVEMPGFLMDRGTLARAADPDHS